MVAENFKHCVSELVKLECIELYEKYGNLAWALDPAIIFVTGSNGAKIAELEEPRLIKIVNIIIDCVMSRPAGELTLLEVSSMLHLAAPPKAAVAPRGILGTQPTTYTTTNCIQVDKEEAAAATVTLQMRLSSSKLKINMHVPKMNIYLQH
jgi:hypothetical protein